MGKTRLATELARAVHGEGATVLFGQADEHLNMPYRAAADALRHLVAHVPTAVLEAHVAEHGDLLARMVPDLLRRVPDAVAVPAGDDERAAVFEAAVDLLGRASAESPVLLLLDDLHWADHPTLLFLRHLAKATATMAVLVVGTYRDTDLSRSHPLAAVLADLRRERAVERIALRGLDDGEVVDLMTASAGHDLDERAVELGRAIHDETGGNPFFIGEVLTHLAESGAIYERDGRWVSDHTDIAALGVPEGVREVIGRRLSALDDEAEKALRAAAAVGAEFDVEILAAVLERGIDDLADVLDEPVQRGLITEVAGGFGRYRFAHALVRQALYEELTSVRRTRLHQRVLSALDERGRADPAELAHHACEAAAMGGAERAVELATVAAQAARSQLAWEEAVLWFRRALDVEEEADPPDGARRARLLLDLGRALTAAGQATDALTPLRDAAELASDADDIDTLAAAAAAFGHAGGVFVEPQAEIGLDLVDRALARVPAGSNRARVRLLIQRARWVQLSDPAERDRLAEEAVALARRLRDSALLLEALDLRAAAMLPAEQHAALAAEMRGTLTDGSPPDHLSAVLFNELWALHRLGDLAAAARVTQEELSLGQALRSRVLQFRGHASAATLALHAGRLDAARRHQDAARALVPDDGPGYAVILGALDLQRIWLAESSVRYRRRWRRIAEVLPQLFGSLPSQVLVADGDERRQLGRAWVDHDVLTVPPVWLPLALAQLASIGDGLDRDVVARVHDHLLRFEGEWLALAPESNLGSADIHLARCARAVGGLDEAVERYERAVADHERAGEVLWRVHATAELAETLTQRGGSRDGDRAADLARAALATAEELDLVEVRVKAEALLARPRAGSGGAGAGGSGGS